MVQILRKFALFKVSDHLSFHKLRFSSSFPFLVAILSSNLYFETWKLMVSLCKEK
jgi:hypothetical protein